MHAFLTAAILLQAPRDAAAQFNEPAWSIDVALESPYKMNGCAVGDVMAERPGDEIVTVNQLGQAQVALLSNGTFDVRVAASTKGELIGCDIGDLVSDVPDNELLIWGSLEGSEDSGNKGVAFVVTRHPTKPKGMVWAQHQVLVEDTLVHGGCVAELDPTHRGAEFAFGGYSKRVHVFARYGTEWVSELAAELDAPIKCIAAYSKGLAVGCLDGKLLYLYKDNGAWKSEILDEAPAGQARISVAGDLILAARDDGKLALVEQGKPRREILASDDKLRGAVLADLVPSTPGIEAATVGYDRRLAVLERRGESWSAEIVYDDSDKFHHLAAGNLDPASPGLELVACGFSGKLFVISRRRP